MVSKKRKRVAMKPKPKQPAAAIAYRAKNHRTAQDPWEAAREDEDWEVERISAKKFEKGEAHYCVHWVGHEETTWEPVYNLVGCVQTVREYDEMLKRREKEAKEAKVADSKRRRQEREAELQRIAAEV